ncbi:MAG: M42 family metallopeptidase [Anaerolineae bacterium]|jgi:putative aminopeptidase FrvX|nr:M42 family metallopeptidase [Chloroflexota bacterium]
MKLESFAQARGVSGNEQEVRTVILEAVQANISEHWVDALGNLICHKQSREGGDRLKVMLAAHMDEIGLIVTAINSDGTLSFDKIGGIDDRVLLSKQVLVGEKAVPGVIGYAPIHLIPPAERAKAPDMSRAVIDIGATDRGGAEALVSLGDYVSFVGTWTELDPTGTRTVVSKALDDRAGCAVLAELLTDDYALDLYGVFTTQEEVGMRGAGVAARRIQPDVAIVLEGTICDDLPKPPEEDLSPVTRLGGGPAITFMDRSFVADRRLVDLCLREVRALGIAHQFKSAVAGGTDAGAIHLTGEGVPAVTIAVPVRYIHAPISMLSLDDFDATVQLVRAVLHALEKGLAS